MKRIIFCGSRDWTDDFLILKAIKSLFAKHGRFVVVHGDARGADKIADAVARKHGLDVEPHPADWRGQGKAAGPIRNRLMLDLGVDEVIAFKDGFDHTLKAGGTENMIRIAREAGIFTTVVSHEV